jgi:hypothetical protein
VAEGESPFREEIVFEVINRINCGVGNGIKGKNLNNSVKFSFSYF